MSLPFPEGNVARNADDERRAIIKILSILEGGSFLGAALEASGQVMTEAGAKAQVRRGFANIAASATDFALVGAVTGKRMRVVAVAALAGGTATNLTFNSNSTAISPLFANAVNGGFVLPFNPHGWFETTVGQALTATTGAGSTTGVVFSWIEV